MKLNEKVHSSFKEHSQVSLRVQLVTRQVVLLWCCSQHSSVTQILAVLEALPPEGHSWHHLTCRKGRRLFKAATPEHFREGSCTHSSCLQRWDLVPHRHLDRDSLWELLPQGRPLGQPMEPKVARSRSHRGALHVFQAAGNFLCWSSLAQHQAELGEFCQVRKCNCIVRWEIPKSRMRFKKASGETPGLNLPKNW